MTSIREIQEQLQDTNAALASLDRAITEAPDSTSLAATGRSLEKRRTSLESLFLSSTAALGIDICSYRLLVDDQPTLLTPLTATLSRFQSMISVVYAAVKSGEPRSSSRVSADVRTETAFSVGYTYPGSFGIALTLPNDRLLIGDSWLDESFGVIFAMANAPSPSDVAQFAEHVGSAPIREMYRWSNQHAEHGIGVDIEWRRDLQVRSRLFLQPPELEHLSQTIAETSDEQTQQLTIDGSLFALDTQRRTFRLAVDEAESVRGRLAEDMIVSDADPIAVPGRYRLLLTRTVTTQYSTDADQVSWQLDRIESKLS